MGDPLRIVLLGKTGSGKSSLANTIFGANRFRVNSFTPNSVTKICQSNTIRVNGRNIQLIDTPGIFDTDPRSTDVSPEIFKCIEQSAPGPHAFLLVLKMETYTVLEIAVVNVILKCFSEDALRYTTVVFTHGDQLPVGMRIEDWANQNEALRNLVQKCGGRCYVIDNTYWNTNQRIYRNNQVQIQALLNTIDNMVRINGGSYYTNGMMQKIKSYWFRFRNAPVGVQIAVFLGVGSVGVLMLSNIPWAVVMEMVTSAATAAAGGVVWVWDNRQMIEDAVVEAIKYLAVLYNLFEQYRQTHESGSSSYYRFCMIQ